jgi:hypothetical protein
VKRVLLAALLAASAALPLRAADPHSIEGLWQLVAASPVAPADLEPHGMMNQKLYFTKDGHLFLLRPEEKLTADIPSAPYTYDGATRKVTLPDGTLREDPAQISGDTMKVTMRDGQLLTYRRVTGEHPLERSFAPISVEVVSPKGQTPPAEPKYDDTDYSKQPFAERIRGVWEVVRYAKLKGDVPAEGFRNDKYVIDDKQLSVIAPDAKTSGMRLPYRILDSSLVLAPPAADGQPQEPVTWSITFNEWQQLVITRDDAEITLRLVQKATNTIPLLPTKVPIVD